MKRIRIIGLALLAVSALSAVAVSTASATLPEFVPANGKFPVTWKLTSGEGKLRTVGGSEVVCKKDSGAGEIANAKLIDGIVIKYSGCTSPTLGGTSCQSGTTSGEIVTNKLSAKPVYDDEKKTKVALLLANEKGSEELFAEFKCGLATIKVKGSVLILITPLNTSTELFKTSATLTSGKPTDSSFWNEAGTKLETDKLETNPAFGYEESAVEGTGDILTTGKIEIKA